MVEEPLASLLPEDAGSPDAGMLPAAQVGIDVRTKPSFQRHFHPSSRALNAINPA